MRGLYPAVVVVRQADDDNVFYFDSGVNSVVDITKIKLTKICYWIIYFIFNCFLFIKISNLSLSHLSKIGFVERYRIFGSYSKYTLKTDIRLLLLEKVKFDLT